MSLATLLLAGFGVAMFLEGLPYFVAPSAVRRYLLQLTLLGDGTLRTMGFGLMVAGLVLFYLGVH